MLKVLQIMPFCIFLASLYGTSLALPDDRIISEQEKIIEYIHQFPISEYEKITIPNYGTFYLDNVDDMIKNSIRRKEIWENHVVNTYSKWVRLGSVVLDIGAHIGIHSIELSRTVGKEGKVLVFEPQPKIFRELVWNMTLNNLSNIFFYNKAVGSRNGEIELASLVVGHEGGTALPGKSGKFAEIITVDSLHLCDVSLMKIDVEFMEEEVLAGARETILRNHPVIILEIQGGYFLRSAPWKFQKEILNILGILHDLGYEVSNIYGHDFLALPINTLTGDKNEKHSSTKK